MSFLNYVNLFLKLFPSSKLESVLMEGNGSFEVQIDILFDLSCDVSGFMNTTILFSYS